MNRTPYRSFRPAGVGLSRSAGHSVRRETHADARGFSCFPKAAVGERSSAPTGHRRERPEWVNPEVGNHDSDVRCALISGSRETPVALPFRAKLGREWAFNQPWLAVS